MALLHSAPEGFSTLGRRRAWIAFAVAWSAPALIGAAALLVQRALGTQTWGDGWLWVYALSALALMSPVFTWFGLVLAAPLVAVLMDRGAFGWLPALCLGGGIGAALGWTIANPFAMPFGLGLAVILRAAIARIAPETV